MQGDGLIRQELEYYWNKKNNKIKNCTNKKFPKLNLPKSAKLQAMVDRLRI